MPEGHNSHDARGSIDAVIKVVLRLSEEKTPHARSLKDGGADVRVSREEPERRVELPLQKLRARAVLPPPLGGLSDVKSGGWKKENAVTHHPRRI
jgi:hypothetical protein